MQIILLRILTIGLTIFMIYRMFKGRGCCGGHHTGSGGHGGGCCSHGGNGHSNVEDKGNNIQTYKDPVCGMFVTPENAVIRNINEQTYYFCSTNCAREFERN